ncbi:MAG: hypothetical protein E7774_11205 [Bradyrhizobium sp.]|nr:MAG: hypothetical protein E7774_11205 [Bradyrhizobium sp.]
MSLALAADFPAHERERPRLRAAARICAFAAAIVAFVVSSMTLYRLGVMYDAPGGSALGKLHPATYLAALALILEAASRPRPFAYLAALPLRFPGAGLFVVNLALIVLYATFLAREPVTPLIDSFLVATILLPLYEDFSDGQRLALRRVLHVVMFANAALGILEFAFHFRLTPYFAGGRPILGDYRSTALFGHPLLNAGSTALYATMLMLGADGRLRAAPRLALLATQLIALIAFGGRTSLALALAVGLVALLRTLGEFFGGRRFDLREALAAALVAPLAVAAAAAAWFGGALAPLLGRFAADRGSTQARFVIFDFFNAFSFEDILIGPDPQRLASLQNTFGVEYGIENGWLGLVFQYGALMTAFFVAGLFALIGEFWRRAKSGAWVVVLLFLLQASSSASLSVKSFEFNHFAILMLAVFDRRAARATGAAT